MRDSLSLFDQAIAHAAGLVRADDMRQMLGLADRARIIELFAALARGDIEAAFREFRDQYDIGADPSGGAERSRRVREFRHPVKVVPATAEIGAYGETERLRGRDFAAKLSMRVLSRMWQMLLKGITEVKDASRPAAAAEMVLVRIAYAADLPTPDEVIRSLDGDGRAPVESGSRSAARMESQPADALEAAMQRMPSSGAEPRWPSRCRRQPPVPQPQASRPFGSRHSPKIVALAAEKRDLPIKAALENDVRLVRMEEAGWRSHWNHRRRVRLHRTCRANLSNGPAGAGPSPCRTPRVSRPCARRRRRRRMSSRTRCRPIPVCRP